MTRAVIFYGDKLWLERRANIFDCRFDAQIIPAGCVVCGYIVEGAELLSPPAFLNSGQEDAWHKTLAYARSIVGARKTLTYEDGVNQARFLLQEHSDFENPPMEDILDMLIELHPEMEEYYRGYFSQM